MQKFNYYSPTRIVFGKGTREEVGNLIEGFGAKRWLLSMVETVQRKAA